MTKQKYKQVKATKLVKVLTENHGSTIGAWVSLPQKGHTRKERNP